MEANFERIEAYEQGQLSAEEQQRFEEELASNEALREELGLYRLSQQAVEEGIGTSLRADMEQWDQEKEEKAPKPIPTRNWRWVGAAAAILLLLSIFWLLPRGLNNRSAPELADAYFSQKIKVENLRGTAADTSLTASMALIDRGTAALAKEETEKANGLFEAAANQLSEQPSTSPNYALAQLQSGILWYRIGSYARAIKAFDRVIQSPNAKYREEARWYRLLALLAAEGASADFQLELEQLIQDPNFSLQNRAIELKAESAHLIEASKK